MSDSFVQASCASAAAVFSTTALYPLEICKAKLVTSVGDGAHKTTASILSDVLKQRGVFGLYQGLGTKSTHAVVQTFGFYYIYSFLQRSIRRGKAKDLDTITNLGIGYLAGVGNLAASLPFEIVTVRSQTSSEQEGGVLSTIANLYKEGGVAAFYRGLAASVLLCINPAIYNTVFDQLKARVLARAQARAGPHKVVALSTVQAFVLGVIAKAIATLLTYPYIRAKMVMQASSRAQRAKAEESEAGEAERKGTDDTSSSEGVDLSQATALDVMHHIIRTEGVLGLFKGLRVQLLRSTLSSALMLMAKERVYFYTTKALSSLTKKA